ncbi:MAG: ribonuclease E/G [Deltaproteobacteria bacterium]|nr:ribonuclease E/G [Deltaproteobacteria bacterium]
MEKIIINAADPEECRVAMLDAEGRLQEYYSDSTLKQQSLSNIYKGVIQNIEPSLQAIFVNFGTDRNGFLQLADIHPEYYLEEQNSRSPDLKRCFRKGQSILVQVIKEPSLIKGAALTSYISLAGRFIVLTPGRDHVGVSRKIENEVERCRLKAIAERLPVPEGLGYIIRTVAEGRTSRELAEDLYSVHNLWEDIRRRGQEAPAPSLIYREQDLAIKILRDHFTSEIKEILVDDQATFSKVVNYIKAISPGQHKIVKFHKEKRPVFAKHQLEEQLDAIFQTSVKLKSGGSIVITPTEALVSIDVNSGKGTKEICLEDTAFTTNLEAAEEVARQLRLRDLGGLVVVDFIDMREERHRRDVERKIREASKADKAKTDFGAISKFGLLELTRQRLRPPIETGSYIPCPHCHGRGIVKTPESASLSFLRQLSHQMLKGDFGSLKAKLCPEVAHYLLNFKRNDLAKLEERFQIKILIFGDENVAPGEFELEPIKKTSEMETVKPGQVSVSLYEEEEDYRPYSRESRLDNKTFHSQSCSEYGSEPSEKLEDDSNLGSDPSKSTGRRPGSNRRESRGRRARGRSRLDLSKNSYGETSATRPNVSA